MKIEEEKEDGTYFQLSLKSKSRRRVPKDKNGFLLCLSAGEGLKRAASSRIYERVVKTERKERERGDAINSLRIFQFLSQKEEI